ncbi:MAG TPA: class II aldolase/adducin family protein, partial [Aggregatilineales bacterium]|nr:class II aldolase/adducin family protein [Aggregatilineales bacterium]
MKNRWNDAEARAFIESDNPLDLRIYTTRLLGQEPSLVLHGGGNTSVKTTLKNLFGEVVEVLYVKGSGQNLATITADGFAPVRLDVLRKLIQFEQLSDATIVREQRAALPDPSAPDPSIETILHAIIPFTFIDHTHADVIVTLTSTPNGEAYIREIYGERLLHIPYVKPGFLLARAIYEKIRDLSESDWSRLDGIILWNHGIFTFAQDAKTAYSQMIKLVTAAEDFLKAKGIFEKIALSAAQEDLPALSFLRKTVSEAAGKAMLAKLNATPEAAGFSALPDVDDIATRGLLTPDHVSRIKRIPMIVHEGDDIRETVTAFSVAYQSYFLRQSDGTQTMLDPAPRWAIWQNHGSVVFGENMRAITIAHDITRQTMQAIQWAEALGGWQVLSEKDIFEIEY